MKGKPGLWLFACVAALAVACGSSAEVHDPDVFAHLSEWSIDLSNPRVESGAVDLEVANDGLLLHELVLVRESEAGSSLTTVNGVVDLAGLGTRLIGEVAELSPDDDIRATIDLPPGRYVVFCNIPGHFDAGMHTTLEASG